MVWKIMVFTDFFPKYSVNIGASWDFGPVLYIVTLIIIYGACFDLLCGFLSEIDCWIEFVKVTSVCQPLTGYLGPFRPGRVYFHLPDLIDRPIIPISHVFVTNSAHFKVRARKISMWCCEKITTPETQKWRRVITRAYLTRAPLHWSEVPVAMVTESFRWEMTILKWRWK